MIPRATSSKEAALVGGAAVAAGEAAASGAANSCSRPPFGSCCGAQLMALHNVVLPLVHRFVIVRNRDAALGKLGFILLERSKFGQLIRRVHVVPESLVFVRQAAPTNVEV